MGCLGCLSITSIHLVYSLSYCWCFYNRILFDICLVMFQPDFDGHIPSLGGWRVAGRRDFSSKSETMAWKARSMLYQTRNVHWGSQYMGSIGKMKKNMGNIGNKMGKSNIWINDDHEDPWRNRDSISMRIQWYGSNLGTPKNGWFRFMINMIKICVPGS